MNDDRESPPPRWLARCHCRLFGREAKKTMEAARKRAYALLTAIESEAWEPRINLALGHVELRWEGGGPTLLVLVDSVGKPLYAWVASDGMSGGRRVLHGFPLLRRLVGIACGGPATTRHEMYLLCEVVPTLDGAKEGGCEG